MSILKQNLYRIVSFDRAVDILTNGELYFAHPSSWDDPYEKTLKHKLSGEIFALCWCRKAQSDAMWRIYSPHGLGVRIGTTRQRLKVALDKAKKNRELANYKIQNVEYVYQEELDFNLKDITTLLEKNCSFSNASKSLFLKRKAFDHERETRLVLSKPETLNAKGITIKIDPSELFSSIWIDPRAPQAMVDAYTYYLKNKLNFKGTVKKSGLYTAPDKLTIE